MGQASHPRKFNESKQIREPARFFDDTVLALHKDLLHHVDVRARDHARDVHDHARGHGCDARDRAREARPDQPPPDGTYTSHSSSAPAPTEFQFLDRAAHERVEDASPFQAGMKSRDRDEAPAVAP